MKKLLILLSLLGLFSLPASGQNFKSYSFINPAYSTTFAVSNTLNGVTNLGSWGVLTTNLVNGTTNQVAGGVTNTVPCNAANLQLTNRYGVAITTPFDFVSYNNIDTVNPFVDVPIAPDRNAQGFGKSTTGSNYVGCISIMLCSSTTNALNSAPVRFIFATVPDGTNEITGAGEILISVQPSGGAPNYNATDQVVTYDVPAYLVNNRCKLRLRSVDQNTNGVCPKVWVKAINYNTFLP